MRLVLFVFVIVTVAPGITPPVLSVTTPPTLPPTCAHAGTQHRLRIISHSTLVRCRRHRMTLPPVCFIVFPRDALNAVPPGRDALRIVDVSDSGLLRVMLRRRSRAR